MSPGPLTAAADAAPVVLSQIRVDKLMRDTNLAVVVATHSWREQFADAVTINAGQSLASASEDKSSSPGPGPGTWDQNQDQVPLEKKNIGC